MASSSSNHTKNMRAATCFPEEEHKIKEMDLRFDPTRLFRVEQKIEKKKIVPVRPLINGDNVRRGNLDHPGVVIKKKRLVVSDEVAGPEAEISDPVFTIYSCNIPRDFLYPLGSRCRRYGGIPDSKHEQINKVDFDGSVHNIKKFAEQFIYDGKRSKHVSKEDSIKNLHDTIDNEFKFPNKFLTSSMKQHLAIIKIYTALRYIVFFKHQLTDTYLNPHNLHLGLFLKNIDLLELFFDRKIILHEGLKKRQRIPGTGIYRSFSTEPNGYYRIFDKVFWDKMFDNIFDHHNEFFTKYIDHGFIPSE